MIYREKTRSLQWLADFRWAMNVMRARRWRRELGFGQRIIFDGAFRPRLEKRHPQHEPDVIAYPDAFYHITVDDLIRAMETAAEARDIPQ